MRKTLRFSFISLFGLLLTIGFAAALAEETPPPTRLEGVVVRTSGIVEKIDHRHRVVTLRRENGELVTMDIDSRVRNLDQVEVGDVVEAEYYELLAVELEKAASGIRERVERIETDVAPKGAKPAATVTKTIEIIASVEELDRDHRLATLRGPEKTVTLRVDDSVNLDLVDVGDDVRAVYVESIAVAVKEADKK